MYDEPIIFGDFEEETQELKNEPLMGPMMGSYDDQTTEHFYISPFENNNLQTIPAENKTKQNRKSYYDQKNCPKLFGKQLNSLARSNFHFNKKKEDLLGDSQKVQEFNAWLDNNVMSKLNNLKDFQKIWTIDELDENKEFKETFKVLSEMFFSKFAMRYICHSSIKGNERKKLFLTLIPMYLRGVKNPSCFDHMKKPKKS